MALTTNHTPTLRQVLGAEAAKQIDELFRSAPHDPLAAAEARVAELEAALRAVVSHRHCEGGTDADCADSMVVIARAALKGA